MSVALCAGPGCGKQFDGRPDQRFCSRKCRGKDHYARHRGDASYRERLNAQAAASKKRRRAAPGGMAAFRDAVNARRYRLYDAAIETYGPTCVDCGEADREVLTIAHLNNDGAAHRRAFGKGGGILEDLRRRGWPTDEGIGVQCANCQLRALRRTGTRKTASRSAVAESTACA